MKKLITILLISLLSVSVLAATQFNFIEVVSDTSRLKVSPYSESLESEGGSSESSTIQALTANGSSSEITVTDGDTVTISWSSDDTGSLTLNGSDVYDVLGLDFTEEFTPSVDTTYTLDNGTDTASISVVVEAAPEPVTGGNGTFVVNGFIYATTFPGATKNNSLQNVACCVDVDISYGGQDYYISLVGASGSYIYIAINDSNGSFVTRSFFDNFTFTIDGVTVDGASFAGNLSNGNAYMINGPIATIINSSVGTSVVHTMVLTEK